MPQGSNQLGSGAWEGRAAQGEKGAATTVSEAMVAAIAGCTWTQ